MPRHDEVEALIIGGGASGAAVAWSLASAGIEVLCLEQGSWIDPRTYPTDQDDWELHAGTDYSPDPNVRKLPVDYPVNDEDSPIAPLMYNAVGGSTIHWSAHFPRFHPSDFRVRSLDGVADDWPITYRQLEPYFDINDRIMGVAGITGDPAYPIKSDRQTPPIPLGKTGQVMASGFDRLGWHWWPSDSAINTVEYDGRPGCNNCGPCNIGCSIKAKASTDVTYWPKALARGAKLVTHARVRELIVGKDGLAIGAQYYDEEGKLQEQRARIVILACNGVGTPRLMLNSRSPMFPDGLANNSGLVGKNLMFHPYAFVTGVFDQQIEGYMGPQGCNIMSQEFYETDLSRGFVRGYSFQCSRGAGPRRSAGTIPWGVDHHSVFESRFGKTTTIAVIGEDLPEEINAVTIDAKLTDSDGIPAPKVTYRMSENSLKLMAHGVEKATEVLKAAGAIDTLVDPLARSAGWHLMGTARMGIDPARSVVDGNGQAHDVRNLFIVDGSVFVTAGAVNPTSTIQAVALHVAEYIKREARNLGR
jgi:choline dehydrogenase-like flavoprotein